MAQPKYKHDCDECKFLGQYLSNTARVIDIYWCQRKGKDPTMLSLTSVIGRYGNRGEEYASSHPPKAFSAGHLEWMKENHPEGNWYLTALELAEAAGVYDPVSQNALPIV